jgi:hypothetical protein
MGNSVASPPTVQWGKKFNRTFVILRNDLPLKELTDVAIILDLRDALAKSPPDSWCQHVLIAGNDKRYAALNHLLRARDCGSFRFVVNYKAEESLKILASL